jgi:acetyl-CoA C-acetyltransferase/acetyl-CoA acyltransferase
MNSNRLVVIDGVRTPFAKAGTDLASLGADELGRIAVNNLLARTGLDPALVDEVIFGCVAQPAEASNVARVIALRAGIPESVPAITVQRNCASGCEAVTLAQEKLLAGRGSIFIVGGTESMSNIPLLFNQSTAKKFNRLSRAKGLGSRFQSLASFRPSDFQPRIGLLLGLTDPVCGMNMGETAEILAREFSITREAQDNFALQSHQRAILARDRLAEEICPAYLNRRGASSGSEGGDGKATGNRVEIGADASNLNGSRNGAYNFSSGNGPSVAIAEPRKSAPADKSNIMLADNGPRENQSLQALGKLKPVFDRQTGTVTPGNASQVTDGAVALLVMSEERAEQLGFTPLGALSGYAYAGCDPSRMGLGPVHAIAQAEAQTGLKLEDADLIELNEAFAAQTLAVMKAAQSARFASKFLKRQSALGEIPREKLNVNGGAIALGHPVGATGARLVLTSLHELRRRDAKRALVTLCVGGGQGAALWLERL